MIELTSFRIESSIKKVIVNDLPINELEQRVQKIVKESFFSQKEPIYLKFKGKEPTSVQGFEKEGKKWVLRSEIAFSDTLTLLHVPYELIENILEYLSAKDTSAFLETCKTLSYHSNEFIRRLMRDRTFTSISSSLNAPLGWQKHVNSLNLSEVGGSLEEFTELNILRLSGLQTESLIEELPECPHLTHVEISRAELKDTDVKTLIEKCPNLTHLKFNKCKITDLRELKQLTHVELSECTKITDEEVLTLVENCPELAHINLRFCEITDRGVNALAQCSKLTHINLSGCSQITNEGMKSVAEGCSELTYLNLLGCTFVTDEAVIVLAEKCPNLAHIELPPSITDQGVRALGSNLTHVSFLGCKEVTKNVISFLAEECPHLTSIDLTQCRWITDLEIKILLENNSNYRSINLTFCQVTDEAIKWIAEKSPDLEWIELTGCDQITDEGGKALLENCPLLAHISVSLCYKITDALFSGKRSLKLASVDLRSCRNVTEDGIKALAGKSPNLIRIHTPFSGKIKAKEIKTLAYPQSVSKHALAVNNLLMEMSNRIRTAVFYIFLYFFQLIYKIIRLY